MASDFPGGLFFGTTGVAGSRLGRSWHFYGLSEAITYFSAKCVHSQPVAASCNILVIPEQTVKYRPSAGQTCADTVYAHLRRYTHMYCIHLVEYTNEYIYLCIFTNTTRCI